MLSVSFYVLSPETGCIVNARDATAPLHHRVEFCQNHGCLWHALWRKSVTNKDNTAGRIENLLIFRPFVIPISLDTRNVRHIFEAILH